MYIADKETPPLGHVKFMRAIATRRIEDGEDDRWPWMYLVRSCSANNLTTSQVRRLRHSFTGVEWEAEAPRFGNCRYRQALPVLLEDLDDASFNAVDGDEQALQQFYPEAPRHFQDLSTMQHWYCRRAREDHVRFKCPVR